MIITGIASSAVNPIGCLNSVIFSTINRTIAEIIAIVFTFQNNAPIIIASNACCSILKYFFPGFISVFASQPSICPAISPSTGIIVASVPILSAPIVLVSQLLVC